MRSIPLTKGKVALVDDADFERVNRFNWYHVVTGRSKKEYACRKSRSGGKRQTIYMHVFITGRKGIDHHDGDGLNNRRENLRPASPRQNGRNRRIQKHSSRFKGVSWWSAQGKWAATLKYNVRVHLGYFDSEEEAAKAYDTAAKKLFGEFALTNHEMLGGYS